MKLLMRYLMVASVGCMLQVSANDAPAGGAGGVLRGRFRRQHDRSVVERNVLCSDADLRTESIFLARMLGRPELAAGIYKAKKMPEKYASLMARREEGRRKVGSWFWRVPIRILGDQDPEAQAKVADFADKTAEGIPVPMDEFQCNEIKRFVRGGCALTFLSPENVNTYFSLEEQNALDFCQFPHLPDADAERGRPPVLANIWNAFYYCVAHRGIWLKGKNGVVDCVRRSVEEFENVRYFPLAAAAAPRPTDEDDADTVSAGDAAPRPVDKDSMDDDVLYS